MGNRVFVCSTCYDLIDLRAELETEIRDMGLAPVMSSEAASDFRTITDVNSIEACLANLRTCDTVVVVLSRRYGPSLKDAGYDDISATHLECREAQKRGLHVYMYVRDRLEADYSHWKRNKGGDVSFAWVGEKDTRLFDFLHEYRQLAREKKGSNWLWTFRNSVELKARLRADLSAPAGKALLRQLTEAGRLPLLTLTVIGTHYAEVSKRLELKGFVHNVGGTAALNVQLEMGPHCLYVKDLGMVRPADSEECNVALTINDSRMEEGSANLALRFRYVTQQGLQIADCGTLSYLPGVRTTELPIWMSWKRVLLGRGALAYDVEEDVDRITNRVSSTQG